jgi:hypothetical protein
MPAGRHQADSRRVESALRKLYQTWDRTQRIYPTRLDPPCDVQVMLANQVDRYEAVLKAEAE